MKRTIAAPLLAPLLAIAAVLLVSGCTIPDMPATFIGSTTVTVDSTCGGPASFYVCGCSSVSSCSTHTGGKILYQGTASFQVSDLVGMYVLSPNMDCSGTAGRIGAGKASDLANQNLQFTMEPRNGCPPAGPPGDPDPQSLLSYMLNSLIDWLRSIISQIFPAANIAGVSAATINTDVQYTVSLDVPAPDLSYADGSVERHYAMAFISDSDGNILWNSQQEEVTGTAYAKTFMYKFTAPGSYAVGAIAAKTVSTYDFNAKVWSDWSAPVVISTERMAVTVTGAPDNPIEPDINLLGSLFNWIINSIRALFGLPPV